MYLNNKSNQDLKSINLTGWNNFILPINNVPLTIPIISFLLFSFWKHIVPKLENKTYGLMMKVHFENGSVRSITDMQILKTETFDDMESVFQDYWNLRSDDYHLMPVSEVILSFRLFKPFINTKIEKAKDPTIKNKPLFSFKGYSIPNTMDLSEWGHVSYNHDHTKATITTKTTLSYNVNILKDRNIISVLSRGKLLFTFVDEIFNSSDLNSFKRIINKQVFTFHNGIVVLKEVIRKCKFIKELKSAQYRTDSFLTMDLETRTIKNSKGDGIMSVVSISIYDGKSFYSFYLNNYASESEMVLEAFKTICIRKYNGYKVYLHNFSYFDSVFLLSIISKAYKITPIRREGSIIELKVGFGNYKIYMHDSMLLLPSSLANLAKSFNVEDKGIFPYEFINNLDVPLNYKGSIPEYKYFSKVKLADYDKYCEDHNLNSSVSGIWDLEKEIVKYCELDVKVLHQVINKFSIEIFDLYHVDVIKYPTLPSLAFSIFRTKFMEKSNIPIITGEMYNDIFQSYTGGAVDLYAPYAENVYVYDVNSLFPSAMKHYPMPVGNPVYFEGDITLSKYNNFGYYYVKVTAPLDLDVPVLQLRVKTKSGTKTMAPVGSWEGWYFSEELENAVNNYGYKVEVIRGYLFEKDYIFKDYVEALYKIKEDNSPGKENADASKCTIAKFLLNMLYGRFGMSPDMSTNLILPYDEAAEYASSHRVTDTTDFKNGYEMIEFVNEKEIDETSKTPNISVSIAAAVTAYSRMDMSMYKHIPGNPPIYSDTDSVFLRKPLDPKFIGSGLGKMKLEYIFKSIVFLAPKVYGGVLDPVNNTDKILKKYGSEIVKVKGLKKALNYLDLLPLLHKDSSKLVYQPKWYRFFDKGHISIKNEAYTLAVTSNKRELVYDTNGKFVSTKPFILSNGQLVDKDPTILPYLPLDNKKDK